MKKLFPFIAVIMSVLFVNVSMSACGSKQSVSISEIKQETTETSDSMQNEELCGWFYSLQEAYGRKYLTIDDIRSIAAYNSDTEIDAVKELNIKVRYAMKKSYLETMTDLKDSSMQIGDVEIWKYYGKYGNCYVVQMSELNVDYPAVELQYDIGGIIIKYSGPDIIVWAPKDKGINI